MIKYVTTGAWGTGVGFPLDADEIDGNFYDLDARVTDLETNPPQANNPESVLQISETAFSIVLHDGSQLGPIVMPVLTSHFRDDWEPLTLYEGMDQVVVATEGVYWVLQQHTSAATFDANAGGSPVTAGNFVAGTRYIIETVGTTDFTLIGAEDNNVGTSFKANDVGDGTGTAKPQYYLKMIGLVDITTGIANLADVELTSLSDKQYLRWDAAAGKWVNTSAGYFTSFTLESQGAGTFMVVDYGGASYADFTLRGANGTKAAPTAILEDDRIGALTYYGHDGTTWGYGASIIAEAEENWTPTAHGTRLVLSVTLNGTTTPLDAFVIWGDGGLSGGGAPSQGLGTINVEGLFVHNQPVVTQASDGSLQVAGSTLSGGLVPLTTGELDADGGPVLVGDPDGNCMMVAI